MRISITLEWVTGYGEALWSVSGGGRDDAFFPSLADAIADAETRCGEVLEAQLSGSQSL